MHSYTPPALSMAANCSRSNEILLKPASSEEGFFRASATNGNLCNLETPASEGAGYSKPNPASKLLFLFANRSSSRRGNNGWESNACGNRIIGNGFAAACASFFAGTKRGQSCGARAAIGTVRGAGRGSGPGADSATKAGLRAGLFLGKEIVPEHPHAVCADEGR